MSGNTVPSGPGKTKHSAHQVAMKKEWTSSDTQKLCASISASCRENNGSVDWTHISGMFPDRTISALQSKHSNIQRKGNCICDREISSQSLTLTPPQEPTKPMRPHELILQRGLRQAAVTAPMADTPKSRPSADGNLTTPETWAKQALQSESEPSRLPPHSQGEGRPGSSTIVTQMHESNNVRRVSSGVVPQGRALTSDTTAASGNDDWMTVLQDSVNDHGNAQTSSSRPAASPVHTTPDSVHTTPDPVNPIMPQDLLAKIKRQAEINRERIKRRRSAEEKARIAKQDSEEELLTLVEDEMQQLAHRLSEGLNEMERLTDKSIKESEARENQNILEHKNNQACMETVRKRMKIGVPNQQS